MNEKSDHVLRGFAYPPPLYDQFCSYFAFRNFVIELLNAKRWAKNNEKWMTRYKAGKFAHFWDYMKNKLSLYWPKDSSYWTVSFLRPNIYFIYLNSLVPALFWLFGIKWVCTFPTTKWWIWIIVRWKFMNLVGLIINLFSLTIFNNA